MRKGRVVLAVGTLDAERVGAQGGAGHGAEGEGANANEHPGPDEVEG